ncbi:hypothetical protein ILYODFUR_037295 [Ilyodon furcidens]|uniref:Uncharacterized protein n=1 Tax=Ilyodon furcidens TaxID=33524 RepID=A0ABV0TG40_9TELE
MSSLHLLCSYWDCSWSTNLRCDSYIHDLMPGLPIPLNSFVQLWNNAAQQQIHKPPSWVHIYHCFLVDKPLLPFPDSLT